LSKYLHKLLYQIRYWLFLIALLSAIETKSTRRQVLPLHGYFMIYFFGAHFLFMQGRHISQPLKTTLLNPESNFIGQVCSRFDSLVCLAIKVRSHFSAKGNCASEFYCNSACSRSWESRRIRRRSRRSSRPVIPPRERQRSNSLAQTEGCRAYFSIAR